MALKSTIFKANLQIADIDHSYYADHALTLARHPSETDERMMVRLVAMALHAHELVDTCGGDGTLAFGAGLSDPEDPDVSLTDFTGRKRIWIEVGQPEDKPLATDWNACKPGVCRPKPRPHWPHSPSAACSCKPRCKRARSHCPAHGAASTSCRFAGSERRSCGGAETHNRLSARFSRHVSQRASPARPAPWSPARLAPLPAAWPWCRSSG